MVRSKVHPGVYRLTADVANPFPNARKRSDWRCRPTWTSNTKFVVEVEPKGVHLRPTGASRAYLLHDRPSTLNAELNAVRVETSDADPVGRATDAEVILVGDLFYDRDLAPRVLAWLIEQQAAGKSVLIGDPGRTYLPRDKLEQIAAYDIPVTRALEDAEVKRAAVWRLK